MSDRYDHFRRMDDVTFSAYGSDEESVKSKGQVLEEGREFLRNQIQGLSHADRRKLAKDVQDILCGEDEHQEDLYTEHKVSQSRMLPKLRYFSGHKVKGDKEVDFSSWRLYARNVVDDTTISHAQKRRIIIESLSGPALLIVSSLPYEAFADDYLDILESHFGEVGDGYDLYAQFRNSVQEMKETASEYLQRLHLMAIKMIDRNSIIRENVNAEVIRQFENGCADEDILARIEIRQLIMRPPTVSFLLNKVRSEEQRRSQKKLRLKSRATASSAVTVENETSVDKKLTSLQAAVQQINTRLDGISLQTPCMSTSQLTSPTSQFSQNLMPQPTAQMSQQSSSFQQVPRKKGAKKRSTFCYNCGQDGHFMPECQQACNPVLVQQKLVAATAKSKSGPGKE